MPDLFISYANEDREVAAALAGKLTSRGYTVWWDHHLVGGAQFRDVIHQQLQDAKAAIVLWTSNGVRSSWVKDEADEALRLNKLIPLKSRELTVTHIPLGHRGSHIVAVEEFEDVLRTVRAALGGSQKLTPEAAIRKGGQAVAEATTLAWRYSYEYGLHIAICFIFVPIFVDILIRAQTVMRFDNQVPSFNIWVQLGIFFGCLGWSSLLATMLRRRYDSGIFLVIILFMLATLLVYLFTPNGKAWEYFANNFLLGIKIFLVLGGMLWAVYFWRNIARLVKG